MTRFSRSVWMSGAMRGGCPSPDLVNDELRVSYLPADKEAEAIEMAQLEWVPWLNGLAEVC